MNLKVHDHTTNEWIDIIKDCNFVKLVPENPSGYVIHLRRRGTNVYIVHKLTVNQARELEFLE